MRLISHNQRIGGSLSSLGFGRPIGMLSIISKTREDVLVSRNTTRFWKETNGDRKPLTFKRCPFLSLSLYVEIRSGVSHPQ